MVEASRLRGVLPVLTNRYKRRTRFIPTPVQMPYSVSAKPTQYDGHLFRSKHEAKFAYILNQLNLDYQYEPTMFEWPLPSTSSLHASHPSGTIRYTPDFYLPTINTFIEVKPKYPLYVEQVKAYLLACSEKKKVVIMWSLSPRGIDWTFPKFFSIAYLPNGHAVANHLLCKCVACGKAGVRNNRPCETCLIPMQWNAVGPLYKAAHAKTYKT
jgi:hypothetical protein